MTQWLLRHIRFVINCLSSYLKRGLSECLKMRLRKVETVSVSLLILKWDFPHIETNKGFDRRSCGAPRRATGSQGETSNDVHDYGDEVNGPYLAVHNFDYGLTDTIPKKLNHVVTGNIFNDQISI